MNILCQEVTARVKERKELIVELKKLRGSVIVVKSVEFLMGIQIDELEKATKMFIMVNESHTRAHEMMSFVVAMRNL